MKVFVVGKATEDGSVSEEFLSDENGGMLTFETEEELYFTLMTMNLADEDIQIYQVDEEALIAEPIE